MITKDILEKLGITPKDLKAKFTAKKLEPKIKDLLDLTADRIRTGRSENLKDYRLWWAMDLAYDAPFRQVTQTLMHEFIDRISSKSDKSQEILRAANSWGLSQYITQQDIDGVKCDKFEVPVFNTIVVPLCRAYALMRIARLWDLHDLYPLFKLEPVKSTMLQRARCELITDIIEMQGQQLGYREFLKQWIINAVLYGMALVFPTEDYYKEYEVSLNSSGDQVKHLKKSGIRHSIPHPSRVFWDRGHRVSTFNPDSGCSFGGYWRLDRYGVIRRNKALWNTDKVSMYRGDLFNGNEVFFEHVYPCRMQFPSVSGSGSRSGAGAMDRQSSISYYTSSDHDRAVVTADIFQKLVPKDWGIADVDVPIWFRFVMANDVDPLYVAPLAYSPIKYMGYDAHEERSKNSSLVLEVLPFQDHFSNLLTQQIQSAKSNLLKAVFVNKDLIEPAMVAQLQNLGEDLYRTMSFIPYSSRKVAMMGQDIKGAFSPVQFPVMNTVELVGAMRMLLDVLERVLVFSAQEVGSPSTHEQTAEEVRLIGGSVSARVEFTDSFVSDAINALKRQLYDALMAYGPKEVYAQVSANSTVTEEALKELGFTYDEKPVPGVSNGIAKGKLSDLRIPIHLEGFSSSRDGVDRINNPEIAASMAQITQVLLNNPITAQAIGAQQAIDIFNAIARMAGLPRDFKLKVANPERIQQMEAAAAGEPTNGLPNGQQLQQILAQMTEEILKKAGEQSAQIAEQVSQPIVQAVAQIQGNMEKIAQGAASQIQPLQQSVEAIMTQLQQLTGAAGANGSQSASS